MAKWAAMFLAALLVLDIYMADVVAASRCPSGWTTDELSFSPKCLHYVPTEATFEDAQKACEHLGGGLAVPNNMLSVAGITNYIQNKVSDEKLQRNVWMDMVRKSGLWGTSAGSVLSSIDWYDGYPEGAASCGLLLFAVAKFKNRDCDLKSAFICEGHPDEVYETVEICQPSPKVSSLTNLTAILGPAIPGTNVYVECHVEGTTLSSGHKKAFCNKHGEWSHSGSLAQCEMSCSDLVIGDYVIEMTEGGNAVGTVRNFTCSGGHKFRQLDMAFHEVKCEVHGKWVVYATGDETEKQIDCEARAQETIKDMSDNGQPDNAAAAVYDTCLLTALAYLCTLLSS